MVRPRHDPYLLAVLAVSAVLGLYQLDWGLPHGDKSWAADALGPLTVFSIARRSVSSWNSGWFYFKYPIGYPLLLLVTFVPYLGFLVATGQLRHVTTTYPYGLAHVESALFTMTLIGRATSVLMVVATVALTYGIGRRLLDRTAGLFSAWFLASAYPVVYYAHTTNLDAAYLFWLTAALWATVVASDAAGRWPYVVLGIAAAMAMSTKEQGYAFLLSLPVILVYEAQRKRDHGHAFLSRWWAAVWNPRTRAGLAAALVTFAITNNALFNPRGVMNRFANLTGHELPGVTARLTPLKFSLFKGGPKEWLYLHQLTDALESSLGGPLLLAVAGGVIYLTWCRRRAALCLLLPAAAYYFVSLRTHDLIQLRYTLPLTMLGALCAGALGAGLLVRWPRVGRVLLGGLCVLGLARAIELDLLLRSDSRYAAEQWMRASIASGSVIETYQKSVYLPRFVGYQQRLVPLAERTIDGLLQRRPDFIVISSAAKKGITSRWNPDWRQGTTLLSHSPDAAAFLDALEDERLPYRRVARFDQAPILLRPRITSLCPEISIFQRVSE